MGEGGTCLQWLSKGSIKNVYLHLKVSPFTVILEDTLLLLAPLLDMAAILTFQPRESRILDSLLQHISGY